MLDFVGTGHGLDRRLVRKLGLACEDRAHASGIDTAGDLYRYSFPGLLQKYGCDSLADGGRGPSQAVCFCDHGVVVIAGDDQHSRGAVQGEDVQTPHERGETGCAACGDGLGQPLESHRDRDVARGSIVDAVLEIQRTGPVGAFGEEALQEAGGGDHLTDRASPDYGDIVGVEVGAGGEKLTPQCHRHAGQTTHPAPGS